MGKKQHNVKWAKMLEMSNERRIWLHTEITVSLKQTATDSNTREKERWCRWHGLHSWLISLILSLQFILNPANGFTESGLGDEFRLTFQYKSNLSYLFSLFNCNFSVCKIINSWGGGCKYTKSCLAMWYHCRDTWAECRVDGAGCTQH